MSESTLPPIEGRAVAVYKGNKAAIEAGDIQAAIEAAGKAYRRHFGLAPTHVALPYGTDPSTVNLYGVLNLARYAGRYNVIVGRPVNGSVKQLELL